MRSRHCRDPAPTARRPPGALVHRAMFAALASLSLAWSPGSGEAQIAGDTLDLPPAARDRIARLGREAVDGWNDTTALRLAELGRLARSRLAIDGDLESYRALTEGHIYFFVDPEEGERSLIRVDQIAVELFWQAPDRVRQRLVGERTETRLPVRDFTYYLDRLTLVQYGFGDEIEVGQGLDVSGVPHPLATISEPDAQLPYDFRLADSITLRLPGDPEPLRIYELQVRPRDPDSPGMIGSIYLDRASGQLVRMEFTFTPASYVDPRTDRIDVELDYGRWDGAYWLPNMQRLEVRREIPELDLGVGTVIRAVLRVGNYELNAPVPAEIATGAPVTTVPEEELQGYEFQQGLLASIERDGLADMATRADPRELRLEATRRLRDRPPTGLSPVRLHLPDLSSFVSYDRSRAMDVGGGASIRPHGALRLRLSGGWSFGPGRPRARVVLDGLALGNWTAELSARWNGQDDLGARPAASDLVSSLGAAALGEDYRDPYRVRGGGIQLRRVLGRGSVVRLEAALEEHGSEALQRDSAPWSSTGAFRPILEVDEGTRARLGFGWREPFDRLAGGRGEAHLDAELLAGSGRTGSRIDLGLEARWRSPSGVRELVMNLDAGGVVGNPLPQLHRLAGGRGTLPGHPFHRYGGRSLVLASLVGAHDLGTPMVRVRGGLFGGWTDGRLPRSWRPSDPGVDPGEASRGPVLSPAPWPIGTDGIRMGVTAGLGLLWDLVRVDAARGFGPEGEWQLLLSVDPAWWDLL